MENRPLAKTAITPETNRMTDREKLLLVALVYVTRQYLAERGDIVYGDNSAGERVIAALTSFGLMEPVSAVVSRWTEEGKKSSPKTMINR
jgi:hypothetical protein